MPTTTVFRARRIHTLNPLQPTATHVAVREGRILAVGGPDCAAPWGPATPDERLADQVLLPGFVEGHSHLLEGGLWALPYVGWFDRRDPRGRVWTGLRSMAAVVQRLQALDAELRAAGAPDHQPLVAWGFDPIYFGGQRMTVADLDAASAGQRPVVVMHANLHVLNANGAMLAQAGITADTATEGVVLFGPGPREGQPTGELAEPAAMHRVLRLLPGGGVAGATTEAGLRDFGRLCCQAGVTTATDLVNRLGETEVALLRRVTDDDAFPIRLLPAFQAFHGPRGADAGAAHVLALVPTSTERLRFGLVKMMLDGSIQGYTARLRWPGYVNGAPNGIWVTAPAQYEADFETYHRAGLTIHTHTNGDEASGAAIDAIGRVLARAPRPGHRHTLQHGQMIDGPQFARMAALGLGANLFANHLWYWGDQHHDLTMGPERAQGLDDCRGALQAGVPLAIHSDAPVTPVGPLMTAWCAANRRTPSGRVLGPERRLSVAEALHAITLGPAWTLGLEQEVGSIAVGKRADFAVLGADPFEQGPEALRDVPVWGTVLGGRVFQAGA